MKATADISFRWLVLRINGCLHLKLRQDGLRTIHSWAEEGKGRYSIEFTYDEGVPVVAEYDSAEKWQAVLSALDTVVL